jgi:hypothetical protein
MQNQIDAIQKILGKKKDEKNHDGRKNPKSVKRHTWTIAEELLAIKLYKEKSDKKEIREAIKDTKVKLNSMLLKLQNLRFLDTGVGLENVSEMTRTLWEKSE